MTDNELGALIRSQLLLGLTAAGVTGVRVLANYQPTSQGEDPGNAIYFFKVSDPRVGWQIRRNAVVSDEARKVEEQNIESTYQFMARVKQDPEDLSIPTASDLLNTASMIMSSAAFTRALSAQGVGRQAVGEMRNPYFLNKHEQFEASPSFDFTVSHRRSIMTAVSVIETINQETHPIGGRPDGD